jgi:hypothetical protein
MADVWMTWKFIYFFVNVNNPGTKRVKYSHITLQWPLVRRSKGSKGNLNPELKYQ